jgi:tRNA modification GTPase
MAKRRDGRMIVTDSLTKHRPSAAVLTPIGRGAVATIRVDGDLDELDRIVGPLFRAANGRSPAMQERQRIAFGRWGQTERGLGKPLDGEDVVVCRVNDQSMEIHCHGGDAAVRRILDDLKQSGCDVVDWRQQLATTGDPFDAECLDALCRATTWRTAEILLEQSTGLLRRAFQHLHDCAQAGDRYAELSERVDALLSWSRFGLRLTEPWSVVLTGRPNVGKSSLINALLGYSRAIVFDEPGTTRDVVTGETAFDGWPVVLADTAGLRETTEELEAAGIALARRRLSTADARLVLVDLSQPPTTDDERLLAEWPDAIVIGHKCDLVDCWADRLPPNAIRVSSIAGEGIASLQQRLIEHLVPLVPPPGTAIPVTRRQVETLQTAQRELTAGNRSACRDAIGSLLASRTSHPFDARI